MVETYSLKVKICLVGDSAVGKTSLIRRYVMDIFDDKYLSTLGTKVSKKQVIIKNEYREVAFTFSIWDVLGQKDFKKIQNLAFRGSKGAMLVCDLTRKDTLENLKDWNTRLKDAVGDIPMIILANKSDLNDQYSFTEDELNECASNLKAPYFKTSAKFGDNVIKSFYKLAELISNDILTT